MTAGVGGYKSEKASTPAIRGMRAGASWVLVSDLFEAAAAAACRRGTAAVHWWTPVATGCGPAAPGGSCRRRFRSGRKRAAERGGGPWPVLEGPHQRPTGAWLPTYPGLLDPITHRLESLGAWSASLKAVPIAHEYSAQWNATDLATKSFTLRPPTAQSGLRFQPVKRSQRCRGFAVGDGAHVLGPQEGLPPLGQVTVSVACDRRGASQSLQALEECDHRLLGSDASRRGRLVPASHRARTTRTRTSDAPCRDEAGKAAANSGPSCFPRGWRVNRGALARPG